MRKKINIIAIILMTSVVSAKCYGWDTIFNNPFITNITSGSDFKITQNSITPFVSVYTGAVANTLYLKTGYVGIQNNNPGYPLAVSGYTVSNGNNIVINLASGALNAAFRVSGTGGDFICGVDSNSDGYFGAFTSGHNLRIFSSNAEKVRLDSNGVLGIGATSLAISDGVGLDSNGKILRLRVSKTPASATATGNAGEFCWDSSYFYICVATNSWHRVAHAAW